MTTPFIKGSAHPEDFCAKCGNANPVWFAPNPLWNQYHGEYNILCPTCFTQLVKAKGFDPVWKLDIEEGTDAMIMRAQMSDSALEGLAKYTPARKTP